MSRSSASAFSLALTLSLCGTLAQAQQPAAPEPGRLAEDFEPSPFPTDAGVPHRGPAAAAPDAGPRAPRGGTDARGSTPKPAQAQEETPGFTPAPYPEAAESPVPGAPPAPPPPPPASPLPAFPSPPIPFDAPPPIFTPPPAVKPALPPGACSLAGEGDFERCQLWFRRTRLIATFVPHYTVQVGQPIVRHGLAWNLALEIPRADWRALFLLGAQPPATVNAFHLGFALGAAWYPGHAFEGRATLRVRLLSIAEPSAALRSVVHVTVGLGAFVSSLLGPGPRVEVRVRVGQLTWGGVVLAMAYQVKLPENVHLGDFSVGFEGPWVWWW